MAYTLILHVQNEEPILGEVDELPTENASLITISNPRRKGGKDLNYLDENAITAIWPVHKLNFIEIISSEEEEEIIGFVRE